MRIHCVIAKSDISTHALTEGDRWSKFQGPKGDISTHALTEGDGELAAPLLSRTDFNSRPHGGRRQI